MSRSVVRFDGHECVESTLKIPSQFDLLFDGHVDVATETPSYPPYDRAAEYQPCADAAASFRAWQSSTMLHYYNKTHPPCQYPHILLRIPRKLNAELRVDGAGQPSTGWGIHLVEGMHVGMFLLAGFLGLMLCSVCGVVWSKLRNDVQGGTGITSCLMYFVTFFVAAGTFRRE